MKYRPLLQGATALVILAIAPTAQSFQGEESNLLPVLKRVSDDMKTIDAAYRARIAPLVSEQRRCEIEITSNPNDPEPHERLGLATARISLAGADVRLKQAALFEAALEKIRVAFDLPGGGPDIGAMRRLRDEFQNIRNGTGDGTEAAVLDEEIFALNKAIAEGERILATLEESKKRKQQTFDQLQAWAKKKHAEADVLFESARVRANGALGWAQVRQNELINIEFELILKQVTESDKKKEQ